MPTKMNLFPKTVRLGLYRLERHNADKRCFLKLQLDSGGGRSTTVSGSSAIAFVSVQ